MNKAILIPIKPIWCAKIMNGEKTIEIRKNKALYKATIKLIEEQGYATFFMYCTKEQEIFYKPLLENGKREYFIEKNRRNIKRLSNGVVVAKFTVRKVEHFEFDICSRDICGYWLDNGQVFNNKKTCLTSEEMSAYIGGKDGYAYHIEDLVIFDKPKELRDFYKWCEPFEINKGCRKVRWEKSLSKAPQNFCYVESEEESK